MAGGTPRSGSSRVKETEPESGPATPSGVSSRPVAEVELSVRKAPKLEVEDAAPSEQSVQDPPKPEEPREPEKLPRLNERLSPIHVFNAFNDGYPSHAVAFIQGALSGAGHDPGPYDGVGGQRTRGALAEFASSRGLKLEDLDSLAEVLDALGFDV